MYSVNSNTKIPKTFFYFFLIFSFFSFSVDSRSQDDLGYDLLLQSVNNNQDLGSDIILTQVEAGDEYYPDTTDPEFTGKNFSNLNQSPNFTVSNHATSIGKIIYGNSSSMAMGVSDINIIGANDFLSYELDFTHFPYSTPRVGTGRIVNHSWVGDYVFLTDEEDKISDTTNLLKHLDWLIANDDAVHVVGVNNNLNTDIPLLSSAFNVISVGKTNSIHDYETSILEGNYSSQRPLIHLVVPENYTSNSTAYISSALAVLVDLGNKNQNWSMGSFNNRNGDTIYNSQRVEVLKSVLMAGASRLTFNSSNNDQIRDYRLSANDQTGNGLDYRYGAGQLDIYSSYLILNSGEKTSQEDGGSSNIGFSGFDYDPSFGGSFGSNNVGTYDLGISQDNGFLQASLSWNLRVDGPNSNPIIPFNTNSTLRNLSLTLIDITSGTEEEMIISNSLTDNTQNIWIELQSGHHYQLKVKSMNNNFRIDYGVAWYFKEFSDFDGDGCYDHLDSDAEDPNITHLTNCSVDVSMITSKGLIFLMIILSLLSYLQIQYSNLYNI